MKVSNPQDDAIYTFKLKAKKPPDLVISYYWWIYSSSISITSLSVSCINLTSVESPKSMQFCNRDQLTASNTTTFPQPRAHHSLGFPSRSAEEVNCPLQRLKREHLTIVKQVKICIQHFSTQVARSVVNTEKLLTLSFTQYIDLDVIQIVYTFCVVGE